MSLQTNCTPRPSVFAADRRATVLSLDTFLKGQVNGDAFFEENYFTTGMLTLVDRAFRHLAGNAAGSSVFLLSQAMGGGKTHSMIALGLLARDAETRHRVLGGQNPAPNLGECRVVGFNGRNTDATGGIWGSIAEQLGKADQFARYCSPLIGRKIQGKRGLPADTRRHPADADRRVKPLEVRESRRHRCHPSL